MRVGSFSVQIPEGRERDSGHVVLDHGRQYTLRLGNHQDRPCDAHVTVDGKSLGGFRVNAREYVTLERSPNDNGRFTFYLDGTADAVTAGIGEVPAVDKGLIQVRFVPERRRERPVGTVVKTAGLRSRGGPGGQSQGPVGEPASWRAPSQHPYDGPQCFAGEAEEKTSGGLLRGGLGFAPGGTGISGHSNQSFVTVADLDGDEAEAVTISIRLVGPDNTPRPLKAVQPRANAVPDPV